MSSEPKTKPPVPWGLISVILVLAAIAVYFLKSVLSDNSPLEESHITAVTLVKPPLKPPLKPPPIIPTKKKPARVERVIKEKVNSGQQMEVEGEVLQNASTQDSTPQEDSRGGHDEGGSIGPPAGDTLGMDTEGGAGGDTFGLAGRKGGRSILAKSGGGLKRAVKVPLMVRFAGYIKIVTAEIKEKVIKRLGEQGGIPKGKFQCIIRVRVNKDGKIIDYRMTSSSGNTKMDQAVINTLRSCRISEPPPEDMPSMMDIMIMSQG